MNYELVEQYLNGLTRDRNDNLDIAWLRDTSDDPEDEMTEPEEIATAIATHLKNALSAIDGLMEEL